MKTENNFQGFLRQKAISGLTAKDAVFARHSADGLAAKTMLFQDGQDVSTLYVGLDEKDTTYLSIANPTYDMVDENTTTKRENFEQKNTLFNLLVVLNSWIEKNKIDKEFLMTLDTDALLLIIEAYDPAIDFRILEDFLDKDNPIHNSILSGIADKKTSKILNSLSDGTYDKTTRVCSGYTPNQTDIINLVVYKAEEKPESKSGKPAPKEGEEGSCGLSESIEEALEKPVEETKETAVELEALKGSIINQGDSDYDASDFFYDASNLSISELDSVNKYAKQIASKLKGKNGKISSISPSKKLNIKNFVKKAPNIYIRKSELAKGKKVNLNVIIDCSGSMQGVPIINASSVAMIFEIIACQERTITGNIIMTSGEGSQVIPFGLGTKDLLSKMNAFSNNEGIEKAITINMKLLQKADYNICISDSNITDAPINRKKYEAKNVFIDGIYIKKTKNKKKHIEHMEEFFSRARVLDNLEAAVEYISNVVIQK